MKKKSSKLAKLERNRFSVFTDNLKKCYFCPKPAIEKHEILAGSNRQNSMRYGYVLPVCRFHHDKIQYDQEWKKKCQRHFEQTHTREEWISIFHRSYLDEKK